MYDSYPDDTISADPVYIFNVFKILRKDRRKYTNYCR